MPRCSECVTQKTGAAVGGADFWERGGSSALADGARGVTGSAPNSRRSTALADACGDQPAESGLLGRSGIFCTCVPNGGSEDSFFIAEAALGVTEAAPEPPGADGSDLSGLHEWDAEGLGRSFSGAERTSNRDNEAKNIAPQGRAEEKSVEHWRRTASHGDVQTSNRAQPGTKLRYRNWKCRSVRR